MDEYVLINHLEGGKLGVILLDIVTNQSAPKHSQDTIISDTQQSVIIIMW